MILLPRLNSANLVSLAHSALFIVFVTQLQIWQDHRFFIVQQSELWVWVSEKFQFSIFLPCKRSRNFAEKISGLYSVLSRVFTDKKFFENVIALRNTFSGDMFVWVPSLSHNRRNGGHFANVKVRHSKTSKCLYERFFCGWRSVESWKTLRRIFTFRFRALQRKLRCIFFFVEFFEMIETKNFTVEFVQEKFIWKTPFMTYPEFDLHHTAVLKY
jgi:hypothetical protein